MNMIAVNTVLLEKTINQLQESLLGMFDNEPHVYKALALFEMGLSNDQIIEYLKSEIDDNNHAQIMQFNEMNQRQPRPKSI